MVLSHEFELFFTIFPSTIARDLYFHAKMHEINFKIVQMKTKPVNEHTEAAL